MLERSKATRRECECVDFYWAQSFIANQAKHNWKYTFLGDNAPISLFFFRLWGSFLSAGNHWDVAFFLFVESSASVIVLSENRKKTVIEDTFVHFMHFEGLVGRFEGIQSLLSSFFCDLICSSGRFATLELFVIACNSIFSTLSVISKHYSSKISYGWVKDGFRNISRPNILY